MEKVCNKCGETKKFKCFSRHKLGKHGRCSVCKVCESERQRRWRTENKEKLSESIRTWREVNREKMLEQMRRYSETHSETIRKRQREWRNANKQKIADYHSAYGQTPAGKAANARGQRKRRAAAFDLQIVSEGVHWTALLERDGGRCQICGEMIAEKYLEPGCAYDRFDPKAPSVDHVLPISRGGQDTFSNSVLAHRDCNSKKGTKVTTCQSQDTRAISPDHQVNTKTHDDS